MKFAMNFMIVPGMLVCSSFLISVCKFIVSKALLISSDTVIVRAGGAIWLNRHCRVLCFVPVLRGCVWYVCCYVRKKALVVNVSLTLLSFVLQHLLCSHPLTPPAILQCPCNYWEEGYGPV